MPRVKSVIFDLDGTLVDAYTAVSQSLNYALDSVGHPRVSHDVIKANVGWGETKLLRSFVGDNLLEQVLGTYRKHHKETLKTGTKFLSGAFELLEDLSDRKFRLAIASNRPSPFTNIILECLNMFGYFDRVVCADQVDRPKPSGQMLEEILADFNLSAEEALYVGDMNIDAEAGQDAGVKTAVVLTGSCDREQVEQSQPFAIIEHISGVNDILKGLHESVD